MDMVCGINKSFQADTRCRFAPIEGYGDLKFERVRCNDDHGFMVSSRGGGGLESECV